MSQAVQGGDPQARVLRRTAAHLSRVQLRRLLSGQSHRDRAKLRGALLFLDVVGFTQLTLEMAREGRKGAEQQLGLMNAVFRTAIDAAEMLGGDIQFFAGDAALVFFPVNERGDLADAVRRALAAAVRIRGQLRSHQVAGRTVEVRLSVSPGDAWSFEVGGHADRWLPLIAGPALEALFALDRKAGAGDVLVDAATWPLIASGTQGTARPDGTYTITSIEVGTRDVATDDVPDVPASLGAALATYVPEIVRSSIGADLHDFVAEFRRVSVVFIGLRPLDPGDDASLAPIDAAAQAIQGLIEQFEGVVHEMMCDDKGTSVVAVFGLPPFAHDDDATRAVQAATAIRERVDPSVEARVGVATGEVFCGLYGRRSREHYGLVGPTINRAARLMQSEPAGRSVVACADTVRAAGRHLDFETLEPVRVKGEPQPVEVHRPTSAQRRGLAHDQRERSMIGRVAETEQIARRLADLAAGRGGAVIVEAEAGMGKTTLLGRVLGLAAEKSLVVHVGGADPIEASTAYFPFRNIVSSVLGIRADTPLAERRAAVDRAIAALDADVRKLAPLLDAVVPLDLPDNELTAQMLGAIRAENLQHLLLAILRSAAKTRPFVLALEDLHWQDPPSWGLCRRILDDVPTVLLVATMRPMDQKPAELGPMTTGDDRAALTLGLLSDDETVEVVRRRLGADSVPIALKNLITERAEGNPFYAEELALALLGSGLMVVEGGTCRVIGQGTLETLSLPATVHGVITSRIDRLGPEVQLTLKVASVVGRSFDVEVVRAVRPRDEGDAAIREHLLTCVRAELLVPEGERGFAFKHALTHETTYALLSAAVRMPLHEKAGRWLEERFAGHLAPWYGRLAHHYSEADVAERALDFLGLAGQQALDAWANQAARDYFARAIAMDEKLHGESESDLRRATWHEKLGEAHYSLVEFDHARTHFERAIRMSGFPKPAFGLGTPWEVLKHVASRYGSAPPPATGEQRERCIIALRAADCLQVVCLWKGDKLTLAHTVFEGTNIARTLGPSSESAFARAMVGYLLMLAGLRGVAERDLLQAVEMAEASGALLQRCSTHMYLGMSYSALGRLRDALVHLTEADEVAGRLGAGLWKHRGKYMRAEATMMSGRMLDAAELFEWSGIYARSAEPPITGFAQAMKSICLLHAGHPAEESLAIVRGPNGIRLVRDNPTKLQLYVCLGALIECHRLDGDYAAAMKAADEALGLAESGDDCNSFMTGYNAHSALAGLFLDLLGKRLAGEKLDASVPDQAGLETYVRRALAQLTAGRKLFPAVRTRELLHTGQFERLRGSSSRARRAWTEALEVSTRMTMPWEEAATCIELAGISEGSERKQWAARAQEVASASSLARLSERARALG